MAKSTKINPDYSSNVFINCPFDSAYNDMLNAIHFTIIDCGFIPRCALEANDSDDIRIEKILNIIDNCKYGIHDLSRTEIDPTIGLPRFNMPLELGLFIGCKKYGPNEKSYLILDIERYRYRNFISDIGGQDIKAHSNESQRAVRAVRDWLNTKSNRTTIPSGTIIWTRFQSFKAELPTICNDMNWEIEELTFMDYNLSIKTWLKVKAP